MRRTAIAALAWSVAPLTAFADGTVAAPSRAPGSVAVYRGSSANVASPVAVYRGSAVRPGYLTARPETPPVVAVGGERIWFVDQATGELTGCRLVSTFTVGVNQVRCTTAEPGID